MSWSVLVLCSNENEYMQYLQNLQMEFNTYHQAITYIMESWLIPYKERFVAVWTDKCMHFGNLTSNRYIISTIVNISQLWYVVYSNFIIFVLLFCRAESSHAKLKRQLGSSQGSFDSCWTQIHALLELQHTNIKASFEKSLIVVQHQYKQEEFK